MADEPAITDLQDSPVTKSMYRDAANEVWARDQINIDDDAKVSIGDEGAWVHAWVWVSNQEAGIEDQVEGSKEDRHSQSD